SSVAIRSRSTPNTASWCSIGAEARFTDWYSGASSRRNRHLPATMKGLFWHRLRQQCVWLSGGGYVPYVSGHPGCIVCDGCVDGFGRDRARTSRDDGAAGHDRPRTLRGLLPRTAASVRSSHDVVAFVLVREGGSRVRRDRQARSRLRDGVVGAGHQSLASAMAGPSRPRGVG